MIEYVKGDATDPIGSIYRSSIIAHIVNNAGQWGAGFVLALSRRWRDPEAEYRKAGSLELGQVQFVPVGIGVTVANLCAQDNRSDVYPPVRYDALRTCLKALARKAVESGASIHMPRIGCGIGGGKWNEVEKIINEELKDIRVVVYDLP